ncbi:MAG: hypothetical protein OXC25_04185 [Thiotrichales bacterium]|nr:hypothetical protein [Thiotrichales bacterium]MCY4349031.1 hypothetical protein [Thiotrichales bacterium]
MNGSLELRITEREPEDPGRSGDTLPRSAQITAAIFWDGGWN